jgi:hypothetical protein
MSVNSPRVLPGTVPAVARAGAGGGVADTAGLLLGRLTVLPALLVLPFLLTSFPLLILGWFKPVPVLVLWAGLAAAIVPWGWRRIPAVTAGAGGQAGRPRTPWWTVAALAAVAIAFGADQAVFHSQFIIVMRDPASYMQFAAWISGHGSLLIPQDRAAFGGASGLSFGGYAFYQVGDVVVPQFMAGLPMALAVGFWAGGARVALLAAPLFGAAAVFTFGGLTARLAGPRWAPLGALVLGLSLPQQFTSRATYSEPLAQILFLGGLAFVVDSLRVDSDPVSDPHPDGPARARWRDSTSVLAALAGLALGITLLVRLDGPSDILPLIPFCGMLLLGRRRQAVPLGVGAIVGLAYGAIDGVVLSRPYLHTNISSVKPMVLAFGLVAALTALAVMLLWQRGLPRIPGRLADVAALIPFAVTGIFAIRPYLEKDWVKLQYAPISLHWVYWYIGGPAILLATVGAAVLTRRCLRGQASDWVLPLMVFAWTITECLYRPAITPDQPWASRRLVPAVLPGFLLLAIWLVAWLTRMVRQLRFDGVPGFLEPVPRLGVAACCALALLMPTAMTTFGIGISDGGSRGFRLTADGMWDKRTYVGEVAAVNRVCAAIPADASVLAVDNTLANRMSEVIRGMCGVPVANLYDVAAARVDAAVRDIERAGRRPVLLGSYSSEFSPYKDGIVRKVMTLNTEMDQQIFLGKPRTTVPLRFTIYSWEPVR